MTKEGCGMNDGWMNLASLLLGLSAWFLPLWGLRRQSRKAGAEAALWCWAGALCCAAALYFQLRYGDSYVQAGDWSALMDTSGAAVWLSGFLLATSCVIQLAVLYLPAYFDFTGPSPPVSPAVLRSMSKSRSLTWQQHARST